jgi:hypothetical protein
LDDNGKRPDPFERRYSLTRWDIKGNELQAMIAPRGNHLAMSPDKQYFVSETFYQTNPVIITRYSSVKGEPPVVIASFDPFELTWVRRFHTNQAFSRDGKRIYYSKPISKEHNGTFYCEIN